MRKNLDTTSLILNEYEVVKAVVEGNSDLVSLYSGYIPRLVNRLERYFIMTNQKDNMLDNICNILDNYCIAYSTKVVSDTLSKCHEFKPLRQLNCDVKIYKTELEAINQLEKRATKQLAFALLVVSKLKNARYGNPTIPLGNVADVQRLTKASKKTKEKTYFELHTLVQQQLVTVPIVGEDLTVDFAQYEGEVAYVLNNTDILKLNLLFDNLFGKYEAECKPVLMIDLNSDVQQVFDSIGDVERAMNVQSSTVGRCNKLKDRFCANKRYSFILLAEDEVDDEEYIGQVCNFMREYVKPNFKQFKKNYPNFEWIVSREFMGCIDKDSGEVLLQMQ